ncbi:AraC family transcriptional regulator [Bordetella genomosp. 9]|uniref:AraC family transcriptional regulator n=1 Tax=Bordetella genomosp. 9 TaxID=1416803 RepID=A0A261RF21_9BORD|nr:AraC family transcriptional regulator [Bordetella genomosp. 9]OZI23565.1 AraC family transcriptional regulator [Bordetella genomosp. 9]
MSDPLAEVVALLRPSARGSKLVEAAGDWRVVPPRAGEPFYCAVLEGQCCLAVDQHAPMVLQAGDFVLVPAMRSMVNTNVGAREGAPETSPVRIDDGYFRVGRQHGPADARMRIGHCSFSPADAALLVPLLPQVTLVRGEPRLAALVQWVGDETREHRPAREPVLDRLLELLLIEALRGGASVTTAPGLAKGLADERLGSALRALHAEPGLPWTVEKLAAQAALSRSAFFARFERVVGMKPMAYLLAWRMALAKRWLREQALSLDRIAERVGYSSASTFSVAFARHVGQSPMRYGRDAGGKKSSHAGAL